MINSIISSPFSCFPLSFLRDNRDALVEGLGKGWWVSGAGRLLHLPSRLQIKAMKLRKLEWLRPRSEAKVMLHHIYKNKYPIILGYTSRYRNQHGVTYHFKDGSKLFCGKVLRVKVEGRVICEALN